jgi:uncharacterized protein DUF3291
MTYSAQHLAQFNIARLRYPLDDPRLADFVGNLDRINALAERMPGFVWRLMDASGNATNIKVSDDPRVISNMAVWVSVEALEKYVWQTVRLGRACPRPNCGKRRAALRG